MIGVIWVSNTYYYYICECDRTTLIFIPILPVCTRRNFGSPLRRFHMSVQSPKRLSCPRSKNLPCGFVVNMTPWSDDANFADNLGKTVLAAYENLPQRGKPQGNEWTVLAAIVLARRHATHTAGYGLQVLVLATGNKCLGESQLCDREGQSKET